MKYAERCDDIVTLPKQANYQESFKLSAGRYLRPICIHKYSISSKSFYVETAYTHDGGFTYWCTDRNGCKRKLWKKLKTEEDEQILLII